MLESHARPLTYQGRPAQLSVIRSNGYCWGRIRFPDGSHPKDVVTTDDLYERTDEDALDELERLSANPNHVEMAHGWL